MAEYVLMQNGLQIAHFFNLIHLQKYIKANFTTENIDELRLHGFTVKELPGGAL